MTTLLANPTVCRPSRLTVVASSQGGPSVPRRLRQNSRLAPTLLAGVAAAQLGLLPMPAGAALEQQPAAMAAIDFLAQAGSVMGVDLATLQDKMGGVALAFDSFPAALLGPAEQQQQLGGLQQQAVALAGDPSAQRSSSSSFRHMNQHGFCYSRILCQGANRAPELAEGA